MSLRWSEEELREWEERRKSTSSVSAGALPPSPGGKARETAGTSSDPARGRATFPSKKESRAPRACAPGPIAHEMGRAGDEPTEDEEQIALFEWAAAMTGKWPELRWLYHVPNGGSRNAAEAGKFKAMGVKSGVPDVALDTARGGFHGLRIEMKRAQSGNPSENQKKWVEHLRAEGYRAEICHGWSAAASVIEEYLKGGTR